MSHTRIAEMLLESGFEAEEMTDVVDALAPLADLADGVPAPTAELAALLGRAGGPPNRVSSLFGPRRSAVAGALVLALSGVGATGLSAAANTLPAPLQHQVSKFSRHFLPFDLPEPPATSYEQDDPFGALLPHGSTDLEGHGGVTASRSAQPRQGDAASGIAADDTAPHVQVPPQPSASPGAAGPSPTASAQPSSSPSSSPTPSSSPSSSAAAEGSVTMTTGKGGQPVKSAPTDRDRNGGKQQDENQDKGKDKGKDKDKDHDKGKDHDEPRDQGPGQRGDPDPDHTQDPGQDPGGGTEETTPAPDLPVPSIPLPDPVPGLDAIVDAVPGVGN